jgi:hypothetical protein
LDAALFVNNVLRYWNHRALTLQNTWGIVKKDFHNSHGLL